jgi:lipopolysaccharide transport system ATP-binding protein
MIKTTSGIELGGGASAPSARNSIPYVTRDTTYNIEFSFLCALNPGIYFLNAGVVGDMHGSETFLHRLVDVAMFRVLSEADSLATGVIDFHCRPKIEISENLDRNQTCTL